jgi:copper chaperone CopZ
MKKVSFSVSGMHCGACELLIKDELSQLKGVSDITIDHKTGKGSVSVADGKITHSDILGAITKAGYKATINEAKNINLEKDSIEIIKKTIKMLKDKIIIFLEKKSTPFILAIASKFANLRAVVLVAFKVAR